MATEWLLVSNAIDYSIIKNVSETIDVEYDESYSTDSSEVIYTYLARDVPHGIRYTSADTNGIQSLIYDLGTGFVATSAKLKKGSLIALKPNGYGEDYTFQIVKDTSSHYYLAVVGTPHVRVGGGQYIVEIYNGRRIVKKVHLELQIGEDVLNLTGFAVSNDTSIRNDNGAINLNLSKWVYEDTTTYATYHTALYYACTDNQFVQPQSNTQYALLQKTNGYWYRNNRDLIVDPDDQESWVVSISTPYSGDYLLNYDTPQNIIVNYRQYLNSDSNWETYSLPEIQAGRTLITPSFDRAGSIPNKHMTGWRYGNAIYPENSPFRTHPAYTTLESVWSTDEFTVTLLDTDGTLLDEQTIAYGDSIALPSAPTRPLFDYLGWAEQGSTTIIAQPTDTQYQPVREITLIRVYTFTLTLSNNEGWTKQITGYYGNMDLPTNQSEDIPKPAGFDLIGWSEVYHQPDKSINREGEAGIHSNVLNVTFDIGFNTLYAEYRSKTLTGLTFTTNALTLSVGRKNTIRNSIVSVPEDWIGDVQWVVTHGNTEEIVSGTLSNTYFTLTVDGRTATILAKETTATLFIPYKISIRGKREEWNSENPVYVDSNVQYVNISDNIRVRFYITANEPYNLTVEEDGVTYHTGNEWYADSVGGTWKWIYPQSVPEGVTLPDGAVYPTNPARAGFVFAGWLDSDGNLVTENNPPRYNAICYASWTQKYIPQDRDVLIFQKFNKDGNGVELQMDMGIMSMFTENFMHNLSSMETPTLPSNNTFVLDTSVEEDIIIELVRRTPRNPNDKSDNPHEWSNGKWLKEVRKLVDRWQSETDGIKMLYIPRGFKVKEVLDDTFGYGDNYAMMGYVYANDGSNLGLLYGDNNEYRLVGYNAVISSFTDKLSTESNRVVTVSIRLTIGGMTSNYEEYRPILGN